MNIQDKISRKVGNMPPSELGKFFGIVGEMGDVLSLGVGEPDFHTPWHIREAAIHSLEQGQTTYTAGLGLPALREEISKYLKRRFDLTYDPKTEILITVGASEAIDISLRTFLENGDEVLIPEPSFVSYSPCTIFAGGVPVPIATKAENQFKLTAEELENAITDKSKLLILSYPNNPTGAIMEREELEKIAKVIIKHNLIVLSDEIYAELTYGSNHVSIATLEGMYERTVVINGFSKAYSMTGWRIGYTLAPAAIIHAITKVHQNVLMCAPTTSQYAAIAAMQNGDSDVREMVQAYDDRRKVMLEGFKKIGLSCFEPKGAFYLFPSIKETGMTSGEFCRALLQEERLAIVPGTVFGASGEGYIRCSYAYSIPELKEALIRIERFVSKILTSKS